MYSFNVFVAAALLFHSHCTAYQLESPSAVKVVFTQTGLNLISLRIANVIENNLKHVPFKKCDGEIPLLAGRVDYSIFDITTFQFHKPTISSKINQADNSVTMNLMSESASISGRWKYNYRFNFFQSSDTGSFIGLIENIEMSLKMNVEVSKSSQFTLFSETCSANITGLKINNINNGNWVYRYIMRDYTFNSKNLITKMLCDDVQKILTREGNRRLETFNYRTNISQKLTLLYHPVNAPTYQSTNMQFDLNGFFEDDLSSNDHIASMTAPSGYMLGMAYSDALFNSAVRVMFKKNLLKHVYRSENFKVLEKIEIPTSFLKDIKSIIVKISAINIPVIYTNTSGMFCDAKIHIQFFTSNSFDIEGEFVRFNVSTHMSFRLKVTKNHIKAKIEDMKHVMEDHLSFMGNIKIDDRHYLIEQALKLFLQPYINDEFNKGIPLPGVDKIFYSDGLVKYEKNYVSFACDFSIDASNSK
ncbi:hypothetical protein HELRODRAFT_184815 [Helobdella robusta]|uniref:Lipid-binding serum glycoprotein C-terminal domain-containing protein n=1 Tax=Helobdella robusta TaxID=6412 RepID=T1FM16_HELRO|nr:hypothetical protein HELRODRAFT_184815 [Helobdella robusta]ESO12216.1 hypothetical protein HELRODRAFT_184815 [Helobdella robusta]